MWYPMFRCTPAWKLGLCKDSRMWEHTTLLPLSFCFSFSFCFSPSSRVMFCRSLMFVVREVFVFVFYPGLKAGVMQKFRTYEIFICLQCGVLLCFCPLGFAITRKLIWGFVIRRRGICFWRVSHHRLTFFIRIIFGDCKSFYLSFTPACLLATFLINCNQARKLGLCKRFYVRKNYPQFRSHSASHSHSVSHRPPAWCFIVLCCFSCGRFLFVFYPSLKAGVMQKFSHIWNFYLSPV